MKVHHHLISGIGFNGENVSRTVAFHVRSHYDHPRYNRRQQTCGEFNK